MHGNSTSRTLVDLLLGDVFVCAGEGNMAMTVSGAFNATAEIEAANLYGSSIRVASIAAPPRRSAAPRPYFDLPWAPASSASIGGANWTTFSAACWFFGRSLADGLGTSGDPIGLIVAADGLSPLTSWAPAGALDACGAAPATAASALPPAAAFGMLSPLAPLVPKAAVFW